MAKIFGKFKELIQNSKSLAAIGSANVVGYAIIALFWFFIAMLLGSEQYGKISYFFAIANIVSVVTFLGAGNTLIVYSAKQVKIEGSIYFLSIISSIAAAIVLFLIFYNLGVSLFVIGYVIFGLITNEMLGRKFYSSYFKHFTVQKILMVGLSIGLYYLIGLDGIILGYGLSFFPYAFILYHNFKKSEISFSKLRPYFRFMMNSYGMDLSRIFINYADKLVVYPLFGYALLGNYQLGSQFLNVLNILPLTVYQYVMSHTATGDSKKRLRKYTILISVIFAIASFVLVPVVIPSIFSKYEKATEIIQIMSLAVIPLTISEMYMAKFLGIEKSNVVFIGSGLFLTVQISTIVIMGKTFGITGAAIATLFAACVECIYLLIVNKIQKIN